MPPDSTRSHIVQWKFVYYTYSSLTLINNHDNITLNTLTERLMAGFKKSIHTVIHFIHKLMPIPRWCPSSVVRDL